MRLRVDALRAEPTMASSSRRGPRSARAARAVRDERVGELLADGEHGVERVIALWRTMDTVAQRKARSSPGRSASDVAAAELDLAARDARAAAAGGAASLADGRLAAARLARQAEDLAGATSKETPSTTREGAP